MSAVHPVLERDQQRPRRRWLPSPPLRAAFGVALTLLAGVLVWLALTLPTDLRAGQALALLQVPVEALVIALLAVLLPRRPLRIVGVVLGVLIAVVVLLKALDIGFNAELDRPFDVVGDWSYLGPALGVLSDASGRTVAILAAIGAGLAACALLAALPWAVVRVTGALARHRRRTAGVLAALVVVWLVCALTGASWGSGPAVASAGTSVAAADAVGRAVGQATDRWTFGRDIADDRFASVPPDRLLTGLRGKDVLLVFVESYGRVALDDPQLAPTVRGALSSADAQLAAAGFGARSAYLTSPTFGGISWLAHSTVESGLWVDSQRRYDQLIAAHRLTLVRAFGEAGWRTVFDVPAMWEAWPQGKPFYGFDALLTDLNVGYRGPRFGYDTMPDQYTLQVFRDRELTPGPRAPVMAEIDLLSSHVPWTPPPPLLPWGTLGDGSVYATPAGRSPDAGTTDPRMIYAQAIAYTMRTLASFAATSHDPNLVIIAMGDHQPNNSVTRPGASHQVPAMVIAHDPTVLRAVAGWGWGPGLAPSASAPVRPMSDLRDRLFSTFGTGS